MKAVADIRLKRGRGVAQRLAWLLLVAFTLQSFIAQTHIEGWLPKTTDSRAIAGVLASPFSPHNKTPLQRGHANCPFCQVVMHAGAFLSPAPLLWLTPSVFVQTAAAPLVIRQIRHGLGHIWQSRAPPGR